MQNLFWVTLRRLFYHDTKMLEMIDNRYRKTDVDISYNDTTNKPQVNGTILTGNKTSDDLSLQSKTQFTTLPNASAELVGKIYQYIGEDTQTYKNGYFYKCISEEDELGTVTYSWVDSVGKAVISLEELTDTDLDSPTDGQALLFNGEEWVNGNLPTQTTTLIEGYLNTDDGKFYVEETYETEIDGVKGSIYVSLDSNNQYRFDGTDFVKMGGADNFDDLSNRPKKEVTSISSIITPLPSDAKTNPTNELTRNGCTAVTDRWIRFDPTNKQGIIIKAGTTVVLADGKLKTFITDTKVDFSEAIDTNGTDYFINLSNTGVVTASTTKLNTGVTIGRFHTLCVDAGTMTMTAPSNGMAVGDSYLVKPYKESEDPDFYAFYNKEITAVSSGSPYDVATMEHPLSGYEARDILPESIFCLTFHPETLYEDAMVYDKTTDKAFDIYLQSGTGFNTRSIYNATHTVNCQQINHTSDMRMVGKELLNDNEFTSMALGSNETTNISGSADVATVGGHSDTANRRMISAIGIEDACGLLWQWTREYVGWTTGSWGTRDGRGSFGQEYGDDYALLAGGDWADGSHCGSRCRNSYFVRSNVNAHLGGRGSSRIHRWL